jgi:hypothetical protein
MASGLSNTGSSGLDGAQFLPRLRQGGDDVVGEQSGTKNLGCARTRPGAQGAATTVSAPLNSTIAPLARAASRASRVSGGKRRSRERRKDARTRLHAAPSSLGREPRAARAKVAQGRRQNS